jgi:hypothetical protein
MNMCQALNRPGSRKSPVSPLGLSATIALALVVRRWLPALLAPRGRPSLSSTRQPGGVTQVSWIRWISLIWRSRWVQYGGERSKFKSCRSGYRRREIVSVLQPHWIVETSPAPRPSDHRAPPASRPCPPPRRLPGAPHTTPSMACIPGASRGDQGSTSPLSGSCKPAALEVVRRPSTASLYRAPPPCCRHASPVSNRTGR